VSGAGTALSPWTFATPPANCKAYYTDLVDAADGVYTTDPSGTNINVYCDMKDGGVTYQDFGFGDYSKTYAGYTFIGAPDFALPEVDAAFAYLYTRNVGLTNLDTSWHSTNCCIMNTTTTNWYTFGTTNVYMYPGNGSTVECNPATYSWSVVTLFLENTNTELTSITAAQASVVTVDSGCSTGNNPAIFVERY